MKFNNLIKTILKVAIPWGGGKPKNEQIEKWKNEVSAFFLFVSNYFSISHTLSYKEIQRETQRDKHKEERKAPQRGKKHASQ